MLTDLPAGAPFDVAQHHQALQVPARLNLRQSIRESRGALYVQPGGLLLMMAASAIFAAGAFYYLQTQELAEVWPILVVLALGTGWSPATYVLDYTIGRFRFGPMPRDAMWELGEHGLRLSPTPIYGEILWDQVTHLGRFDEVAVVRVGNNGYGLAARQEGPTIEDLIDALEQRTGLKSVKRNRLLWFLAFGPLY